MSKYEYTNDALGRRSSVTVSGSAFNATGTTGFDLFTYNDRNELASAKRYTGGTLENPSNPVYTRHFGYDYDPIGNRESYQIGQGTVTTYTANELNQYSATANPSESFTHDDDGNLTQDGTYTYVWDAENRLIEVYSTNPTTGSQKCVMTYDYMNRRVQRSLYNWTGSAWSESYFSSRIFVYDGWNNLIAYNPAGGLSAFRKNTWGLDLSGLNGNSPSPLDPNRDRQGAAIPALHAAGGIAGLIGSTVANALPPPSYLCFYDANGNLSETIKNSDGTLYSHHEYDPWGNQLVKYETAGIAHPFRYSTKYSDGLFEKYYFGLGYLDYRHARWLTRALAHFYQSTHTTQTGNSLLSLFDAHEYRMTVDSSFAPTSAVPDRLVNTFDSCGATVLHRQHSFGAINPCPNGQTLVYCTYSCPNGGAAFSSKCCPKNPTGGPAARCPPYPDCKGPTPEPVCLFAATTSMADSRHTCVRAHSMAQLPFHYWALSPADHSHSATNSAPCEIDCLQFQRRCNAYCSMQMKECLAQCELLPYPQSMQCIRKCLKSELTLD
ncbi:MAG: hypothetical protein L6R00_21375 [Phycisphaerae bacterium]|nr:hypothetical protein [Phycisphaerae bacterium]